jgi:hypothetical protein
MTPAKDLATGIAYAIDAFALRNVGNKRVGVFQVPFAGVIADDEFFAGGHRQESVLVANLIAAADLICPLLGTLDTTPQFINLQRVHVQVTHKFVVKLLTFLADSFQHVQDCVRVTIHNASGLSDSQPLCEQFYDLNDFGVVNSQPVQRLRFGKCFSATKAAETAHDAILVSEIGEMLGFAVTA